MGAAYGSAGERCMAISVAVPVGEQTADALIEKLVPKIAALKIGPGTDREAEMGPLVTAQHLAKVRGYVDEGVAEGRRSSSSTAAASRHRRATRTATSSAARCSTASPRT